MIVHLPERGSGSYVWYCVKCGLVLAQLIGKGAWRPYEDGAWHPYEAVIKCRNHDCGELGKILGSHRFPGENYELFIMDYEANIIGVEGARLRIYKQPCELCGNLFDLITVDLVSTGERILEQVVWYNYSHRSKCSVQRMRNVLY